jgi:hypothetical protein
MPKWLRVGIAEISDAARSTSSMRKGLIAVTFAENLEVTPGQTKRILISLCW